MTDLIDCEEFRRWISQGRHTFSLIESDIQNGGFEWACLKSQQVAEIALKALLKAFGKDAFGHGLLKLYDSCEQLFRNNGTIKNEVSYLDKFYTLPRCPEVFTEGSPWEHFTEGDAEMAKKASNEILLWATELVKECK